MPAKPLSLADRIRAQRKSNRTETEVKSEIELVKAITIIGQDNSKEPDKDRMDVVRTSDEHPTNDVRTSDVKPTSNLQPSDIQPSHLLNTSLVHHTYIQQPTNIHPTSDVEINTDDPIWTLSDRQAIVLAYYVNKKTRIVNRSEITNQTGIPIPTVKDCLKILVRERFISKPERFKNFGSKYKIYSEICDRFLKDRWPSIIEKYGNPPSVKFHTSDIHPSSILHTSNIHPSSDHHPSNINPSFNSSSSNLNTTTSLGSDVNKILSEIFDNDPEYKYWLNQQVTSKQVEIWKNEFDLDIKTILNNLCYVRWQILNQKPEINKSPASYLYGIMKKNGGTVNKPAGYKTMAQQDLEFYENWKNNRIEHTKSIERLKKEALKSEISSKVMAILLRPSIEDSYIQAAIKNIHSTAKQDSITEMIKNEQPLDENSKASLRGYLEMILTEEALQKENI